MKKILKSTLVVTLLSSTLMAQTVFDLGAQELYNSVEQNYKGGAYDLGTSIASTGMAFKNGRYEPKALSSGGFSVQVKEPKPHWSVNFDMYCYLYSDGCSVDLIGDNGQAINILFERYNIRVNGVAVNDTNFGYEEVIGGAIDGYDDNISVNVAGRQFNFNMPNFNLANVSIGLSSEYGENSTIRIDGLSALSVTSSD